MNCSEFSRVVDFLGIFNSISSNLIAAFGLHMDTLILKLRPTPSRKTLSNHLL